MLQAFLTVLCFFGGYVLLLAIVLWCLRPCLQHEEPPLMALWAVYARRYEAKRTRARRINKGGRLNEN